MSGSVAYPAKRLFDGEHFHEDVALLVRDGSVAGFAPVSDLPNGYELHDHEADLLVPGFVDLQVNGGGGALLNDTPTKAAIETICSANARFGTTSVLPTLITDGPEARDAVLAAGRDAKAANVPGFLGLHLEGPHLSRARKGAHVEGFIRPMNEADLAILTDAAGSFGQAMTTIAPENVTPEQVKALVAAGWKVSVGHTDCKAADAKAYFEAGASMVTHLFNAMSQMGNREPGVVGAALTSDNIWCGLIADCVHVDPLSMAIALRAKQGAGRIFFVTDAMSPTGTDATEFILGGRTIYRRDGRLTLADGTLAGADIDMLAMIKLALERLPLSLADVLNMASLYPSQAIGAANKGHLRAGADADFVLLGADLSLHSTWIGGQCCFASA